MAFVLSQSDKDLLSHLKKADIARRRLNRIPQRRRRTPPAGKGGTTTAAEVDLKIVLIDADIPGIDEIEETILEVADIPLGEGEEYYTVVFEDTEGNPLESLPLWGYDRQQTNLKYFREMSAGDEWFYGHEDVGMLLDYYVTTEPEYELKTVRYKTIPIWTDDGKQFTVGEYDRSDYPDYPENEDFPPAGLPENFLKRRYRGIAINNVLITGLCKVLPAPPLPETPPSS